MFRKLNVPILGVVENMSYFVAPDTGARYAIFGEGGGAQVADEFGVPLLGQHPARDGDAQGRRRRRAHHGGGPDVAAGGRVPRAGRGGDGARGRGVRAQAPHHRLTRTGVTAVYLPIFPLPDQTFFPHTLLPLHIFEARYRAMITDCMARDRRLAIASLKPGYESSYDGRPPVNEVVGIGKIVRCERLPTGRFNILLHGECRARIERELPSDTLYRLVQAMPLGDVGGDRPAVSALTVRGRSDACRFSRRSAAGGTR